MRLLLAFVIVGFLSFSKTTGNSQFHELFSFKHRANFSLIIAELPNVKYTGCKEIDIAKTRCLVIIFSHVTEYAGLDPIHGSLKVLEGKLYDKNKKAKPDSRVSVSDFEELEASRLHCSL